MARTAFLFDLDGVLVDTAVFHYQAWRRMTRELGFDIDAAFNETLKGISRMDSLERILAHGQVTLTQKEKEDYATRKNEWYLELVNQMTPADILPGVENFLRAARAENIRIALGSASKNAPVILEKTGILPYFDAVIDGNQVSRSKPDPEVFLKGAQAVGLPASSCVVFEDAFAGIEAAKAAHMYAVGIGSAEVLHNADVVIPDFERALVAQFVTRS